jgi:hypothetical protein
MLVFADQWGVVNAYMGRMPSELMLDRMVPSLDTQVRRGVGDLGPFIATYEIAVTPSRSVAATRQSTGVDVPDRRLDWQIELTFDVDLGVILPDLRLPPVVIDIPGIGEVSTPTIQIVWPTIAVSVSFGDFVEADAPERQLRSSAAALLGTTALAAAPVLLTVPFGGPALGVTIDMILSLVGINGVTGFLEPAITPLISNRQLPEGEESLAISA